MNSEIRQRIDQELPPGGMPVTLDADTVLRSSRSRRMKRRMLGGGAALTSVVAVVAVVLSVMTLAPGGGDSAPDGDAATRSQADVDEPVLDPDKDYYWDGAYPAKNTEAAKSYTSAFWEHFTQKYSDVVLVVDDAAVEYRTVTDDFEKTGFFYASEEKLYEGNQWEHLRNENEDVDVVQRRNVLKTYDRFQPGTGSNGTSCCGMTLRFDGDETTDTSLNMLVLPKGSYTKRTGDAMDPAYCQPEDRCDIEDATGPDGEDVQNFSFTSENNKGEWHTHSRGTVLYREDGTAVVVKVNAASDGIGDVADRIDFDGLLDIATALPGDAIT